MNNMIGKKVIVRSNMAGVYFGTLIAKEGSEITLENCRKLWYWSGAASDNQLASDGVACPEDCKFTVWNPLVCIMGVDEIIPCSDKAATSIEGVKEWKR